MRLNRDVWLVGSGALGLSSPGDCHVYAIKIGDEIAVIDTGCGDGTDIIVDNLIADGLDPVAIRYVLLTHAHRDHCGGCVGLRRLLSERFENSTVQFVAGEETARLLDRGTVEELGLDLLGFGETDRETALPYFRVDLALRVPAELTVGTSRVSLINTPGHSADSICFCTELAGGLTLFSGDTINVGGFINTGNWPGCDLASYRETIAGLSDLEIDALFPAHHLFALSGGSAHIAKAHASFQGLLLPRSLSEIG